MSSFALKQPQNGQKKFLEFFQNFPKIWETVGRTKKFIKRKMPSAARTQALTKSTKNRKKDLSSNSNGSKVMGKNGT